MKAVLELKRAGVVLLAAFVSFKLAIAVFSDFIPSQPFYGFSAIDWLSWVVDRNEFIFITVAAIVQYSITRVMTWKIHADAVALGIWAVILGAYAAAMIYPFNILGRLDALPEDVWPPGAVGAVLEILLLVGSPIALFLVLTRASRLLTERTTV